MNRRIRGKEHAMLSARLPAHVTIETRADNMIAACFAGASVPLGRLSAAAAVLAQGLRTGLPMARLASDRSRIGKEIHGLVQRLAGSGLLEYCLERRRGGEPDVVIEPQMPDYWPGAPPLRDADVIVLSRFAYMRRRGNDMVLESPRAGALFKLCNPSVAAALLLLTTPQPIRELRRRDEFPGLELLALLADSGIARKVASARADALRAAEGDDNLALWEFHDLLFHARSTQGRHANPMGAAYSHVGAIPAPPAVRQRWPGKRTDLRKFSAAAESLSHAASPSQDDIATDMAGAALLRRRHSSRSFDPEHPITLAELARFLDATARVQSRWSDRLDFGEAGATITYAARPYPSAGGSYELELYLAIDKCEGLARGFYHYDAGAHALTRIAARGPELDALLHGAAFAMGVAAAPQILITIAARFGRMAWKYRSIAYALILKDVGVLMQTLYLLATDMGLGGCAIGIADIDLFARMTGIQFHVEGPVGQFALGRGAKG
jgi:SagB-type dehydrogenase family enzyme